jgi:hypothetical protein
MRKPHFVFMTFSFAAAIMKPQSEREHALNLSSEVMPCKVKTSQY